MRYALYTHTNHRTCFLDSVKDFRSTLVKTHTHTHTHTHTYTHTHTHRARAQWLKSIVDLLVYTESGIWTRRNSIYSRNKHIIRYKNDIKVISEWCLCIYFPANYISTWILHNFYDDYLNDVDVFIGPIYKIIKSHHCGRLIY